MEEYFSLQMAIFLPLTNNACFIQRKYPEPESLEGNIYFSSAEEYGPSHLMYLSLKEMPVHHLWIVQEGGLTRFFLMESPQVKT